jgi:hypothetical protein
VPVLARYHARLLAAARSAGTGLVCGGADPGRRNITNPLITALDGGGGLGRGGAAARGHRAAMIPLAAFGEIIDASGVAPRIEALLPASPAQPLWARSAAPCGHRR